MLELGATSIIHDKNIAVIMFNELYLSVSPGSIQHCHRANPWGLRRRCLALATTGCSHCHKASSPGMVQLHSFHPVSSFGFFNFKNITLFPIQFDSNNMKLFSDTFFSYKFNRFSQTLKFPYIMNDIARISRITEVKCICSIIIPGDLKE